MMILDSYLDFIHSTNSNFLDSKKKAFNLLKTYGLPDPKNESWRNINLKILPLKDINPDSELESNLSDPIFKSENDSFLKEILSFNYNQETNHNIQFNNDFFSILNVAFLKNIIYVKIPNGIRVYDLHLVHKPVKGNSFFPFTVLHLEPFAELNFIEEWESAQYQSFWDATTYIIAEENSRVFYTQIRNFDNFEFFFPRIRVLQKGNSYVHLSVLQKGGLFGKSFLEAKLLETNCEFRGVGFYFGEFAQYHNSEMCVEHFHNYATSSLLYKTIVKDRAHSVFIGKFESRKGLRGVVSHQMNHNLILSKNAKAESRPWLVIRSEDIQCEHGATVGELDEEVMFYLKTRGLTEKEAKNLLIQGYVYDILAESKLSETKIETYLQQLAKSIL